MQKVREFNQSIRQLQQSWKTNPLRTFFFAFKISNPKNPNDPTIGLRWLKETPTEGHLNAIDGNENAFHSASVENAYSYCALPLSKFGDPEGAKRAIDRFMAGESQIQKKKPRRKRTKTEAKKLAAKVRYDKNRECRICSKITDKLEEEVFETKCGCKMKDGKTPPARRIHMECFRRKLSPCRCNECGMVYSLP